MFDYFGVLISVIFGLALTHLLRGLGRLIQKRHETRLYWVHIVWTINLVLFVLAIWWGMYWWKGLQDWTIGLFAFISGYAVVISCGRTCCIRPSFPQESILKPSFLIIVAGSSAFRC